MQGPLDFGHGNDFGGLARCRIHHQGQTGVLQIQLTGQRSFRHAGHADDVAAVTFQSHDLGDRFQTRPLGAGVHALIAVFAAFGGERGNQLLTQRLAVGKAEIDMSDVFQIIGEIGVLAPAGVVDDLMRHAEMPGAHGRVNPAHRIHGDDRFGTGLLQRPQVGAVVDLVRREAMRVTVTGEKQHFLAGVFTNLNLSRRRAVRSVDCQRLTNAQAFELCQAGATDDCVNGHNEKILNRSVEHL